MNAEGTQLQLETVLEQQARCSTELLQCLNAERKALAERNTDALEKISQDKSNHTQTLEQLETRRKQLVSALDCGTDANGMQRCINKFGDQSRLASLWKRVIRNIGECRDSNIANGAVLEIGRQHVEQALTILRGESAGPMVYDAQGVSGPVLGQREFGKV
jgi:flagellar biosynthesis/type III secretory pathway chaperone